MYSLACSKTHKKIIAFSVSKCRNLFSWLFDLTFGISMIAQMMKDMYVLKIYVLKKIYVLERSGRERFMFLKRIIVLEGRELNSERKCFIFWKECRGACSGSGRFMFLKKEIFVLEVSDL